jgi:hypothetical protein
LYLACMPISQSDQVFRLVKSLSKSEKRNFTVYSSRIQETESLLYIKLFELLDKQKVLNEREILRKMGGISSTQYSNLKRHLYTQILTSLRHIYKEKKANIKIREYIDFAYILYGKGLYMSALKLLDKAKKHAKKNYNEFSALTIVEIEKMIQSRHITRTDTASIESLVEQSSTLALSASNIARLSNLMVLLHRYYIRRGHVRNLVEEEDLKIFFMDNMPKIDYDLLGVMERVYYYQCYVWYYYILNDFESCANYALDWVHLFESNSELQDRDVDLYLRGFHYVLTSAFNNKDVDIYIKYLDKLSAVRKEKYPVFNDNSKITSFLYVHNGRLNKHFLKGTYEEGIKGIPKTLSRMKRYAANLDEHKIMILHFKIAWMYLGNDMPNKANDYLIKIINLQDKALRKDMQIYARLMHLMVHYDSNSIEILGYLVDVYESYVQGTEDINAIQSETFKMFKALNHAPILERKQILAKYITIISELAEEKYTKRALLYLDILTWLQSRYKGIPMSAVALKK